MINKFSFGPFIREKRLESGMTQKELAEVLLLNESVINEWEDGKSYPDISVVTDICKVLNISEHELIFGANDPEYRKIQKQAKNYRRLTETFFWGFTWAYVAAFIICLICDIAINRGLTFSPIVFGSLLVAFTFIPTCIRFTTKHKFAVFTVSTYLSLVILFAICCFLLEQNWFGIATTGTLLGYIVCLLPFLIKRYIPLKYRNYYVAIYFAICFICLFILLFVTRITVEFDLAVGILLALFAMIPFTVISIMHVIKTNIFIKAAIDTLIITLTLYGAKYWIDTILGYDVDAYYQVDFNDWYNYSNGNVNILIFILGIILFVVFWAIGIWHKFSKESK